MQQPQPSFDRSHDSPSHTGNNVLPADPLFTRLLMLAYETKQRSAVRDLNSGVEKTYLELLSDVVSFRCVLERSLEQDVIHSIADGREIFISLLAPGGYEFAVSILAILALGACVSPLSSAYPVKEAAYFVSKTKAVAVVVTPQLHRLGQAIANEVVQDNTGRVICVPIEFSSNGDPPPRSDIQICSNGYIDLNRAGLVLFTSGTTGPPKAAILSRGVVSNSSWCFAQQMGLEETAVLLHMLPVHHATGVWLCFFPFLLAGACIEFKFGSFDAEWTWRRWVDGGISHFSGVPTMYVRMMKHYREHQRVSPTSDSLMTAARNLKTCLCGTSALPKPVDDFWTNLRGGRRICQRYGSTELGVVFAMGPDMNADVPDGSVGELIPGVDVKISAEGEALVRSFHMFSRYLGDSNATVNSYDAAGYYRSGDIVRQEGKYWFIVGRASVDILKSGGYKISALDVERELLALPYVAEAMVVGVPDDEFGQRISAVLSLAKDDAAMTSFEKNVRQQTRLRLSELRNDLRGRLAGYKLPTILRIVDGELPTNGSGKVVKKTLGPMYFPKNYTTHKDVEVWASAKKEKATKL